MRIQTEILIDKYRDRLFAAAFSVCKNAEDADDVVQETFIKYHTQTRQLESEEHIRAWLIRVAVNAAMKQMNCPRRDGRASAEFLTYLYSGSADALKQGK